MPMWLRLMSAQGLTRYGNSFLVPIGSRSHQKRLLNHQPWNYRGFPRLSPARPTARAGKSRRSPDNPHQRRQPDCLLPTAYAFSQTFAYVSTATPAVLPCW